MKSMIFLVIGIFLLTLVYFNDSLLSAFPTIFEPVSIYINDIGTEILRIGGVLAIIIAVFSSLSAWTSLLLFAIFMYVGGDYLSDKTVSVTVTSKTISVTVDEK